MIGNAEKSKHCDESRRFRTEIVSRERLAHIFTISEIKQRNEGHSKQSSAATNESFNSVEETESSESDECVGV